MPRKTYDGRYISIKDSIYKSGIKLGLSRFKHNASVYEISKYLPRLKSENSIGLHIINEPFPKDLGLLGNSTAPILSKDLEKELFWQSCIFNFYICELNEYIILKEKFSEAVFIEDYKLANSYLDTIFEKFGYSLWYFEQKLNLLEIIDGLDKQKEYMNKLVNMQDIDGVARYLLFYYSIKSERNLIWTKYNAIITDVLGKLKADNKNNIYEYFKYKLSFFEISVEYDYNLILTVESKYSIIDQYNTFIQVCESIIASGNPENKMYMPYAISNLKRISDYKLRNIELILGIREPSSECRVDYLVEILDKYTIGQYEVAVELCNKIDMCSVELYEIFAKCLIHLNKDSDLNKYGNMIGLISNIIMKNENASESINIIMKLVYMFSSLGWASQLYSFIIKECSIIDYESYFFYRFGLINSFEDNPLLGSIIFNEDIIEKFYDKLQEIYPNSDTIKLHKNINGKRNEIIKIKNNISYNRYLKYEARLLEKQGFWNDAIQLYNQLLSDSNIINSQDAIGGLLSCYISLGTVDT